MSVCLFLKITKNDLYFVTVMTVISVMISILTKIQSLSNLSGKYPKHIEHPQSPQHLYPQTKPIVPKLLPTIWEQICQKCHYNFRVIAAALASLLLHFESLQRAAAPSLKT